MEQLVRDARITTIYEGTNGIQALDLIGRKLNINNGILFKEFIELIDNYIDRINQNHEMSKYLKLYLPSYENFKNVLSFIKSLNDEKEINSHAVEFLNLSSLISLGYIWLRFIEISLEKSKESGDEFYNSKIETGNFFLTKLLTETQMLHENIKSGGKYYNDYKDQYFETAI
tara:strand:- start:399 stop:914 length:516 start_codon:yes stop_codon:yes gene_type:complete